MNLRQLSAAEQKTTKSKFFHQNKNQAKNTRFNPSFWLSYKMLHTKKINKPYEKIFITGYSMSNSSLLVSQNMK